MAATFVERKERSVLLGLLKEAFLLVKHSHYNLSGLYHFASNESVLVDISDQSVAVRIFRTNRPQVLDVHENGFCHLLTLPTRKEGQQLLSARVGADLTLAEYHLVEAEPESEADSESWMDNVPSPRLE